MIKKEIQRGQEGVQHALTHLAICSSYLVKFRYMVPDFQQHSVITDTEFPVLTSSLHLKDQDMTWIRSKSWTRQSSRSAHIHRTGDREGQTLTAAAAPGESASNVVPVCGSRREGCLSLGGNIQSRRHCQCLSPTKRVNPERNVIGSSDWTWHAGGKQRPLPF